MSKKEIIEKIKLQVLNEIEKERLTLNEIHFITNSLEMLWVNTDLPEEDKEQYNKAKNIIRKLKKWYVRSRSVSK